jgi:hypothetical protein
VYYENLLEKAKKFIHYDTSSITHTHKHETHIYSMHVESYPARAEIPELPYCVDTFITSKSIKLRKTQEVTSFPPMFLEIRHTTTFTPRRKETLIHQSLCLKWSLEIKSLLQAKDAHGHILGIHNEC